jgi:hypothetical protein
MNFRNGEFWKAIVEVNHTGYQFMVDLSPKLLQRHPKLLPKLPTATHTTSPSLLHLRRRVS